MHALRFVFFAVLLFFASLAQAQPVSILPARPATYEPINDATGTLDAEKLRPLRDSLIAYEKRTSTQIVVVVINKLSNYTVEEYATTLYNHWGIGQKSQNNGALLLVALVDRKMRIEVGYGLESSLSDAYCAKIIENTLTPLFKEKKYEQGITEGIYALIARADSSPFFRADAVISVGFLEKYWIRLLLAVGIFAFFFRKSTDMMLQHIIFAALFLTLTDTPLWDLINIKGENEFETPQTAAFVGSLFSLAIWIPAVLILNRTGGGKQFRPVSPIVTFFFFFFAFSCTNVFGLGFIGSFGYTIFISVLFGVWAYCFERHTKKENTDISKLPLLPVGKFATEFAFYTSVGLLLFAFIIFVLDELGLSFMQHFIIYIGCFGLLPTLLITVFKTPPSKPKQKNGRTYGDSKNKNSSASYYNDYSDYSDRSSSSGSSSWGGSSSSSRSSSSSSSWGGGSSGGGGASGSW
jgi:uncharacterized membrane protein YgcG